MGDIYGEIDDFVHEKEDNMVAALQYTGEKYVNDAREGGTYRDITGNLRSSIGYLIATDGQVTEESFPGDKAEGTSAGKRLALKEAKGKGIVLVGTAGMEYAQSVEARGKDVITKFANAAQKTLKSLIKEI